MVFDQIIKNFQPSYAKSISQVWRKKIFAIFEQNVRDFEQNVRDFEQNVRSFEQNICDFEQNVYNFEMLTVSSSNVDGKGGDLTPIFSEYC